MRTVRCKSIVLVLFVFSVFCGAYAQSPGRLYYEASKAARSGRIDFAYMHLNELLRCCSDSLLAEKALFGVGEYYFSVAAHYDAASSFIRFNEEYPQSKARLFALAYIFEIARSNEREDLQKHLEREILTFKQLSLLFADYKEYVYVSPLFSKEYKAVHFIDRIEFYIDGELFTKVPY
ncbi:MAG: hypothetical protein JSW40_08745 [Candidatus Omnitrophota bacterium]|nr:MAG: hypothetical protein JSW40_08745 [Candidatus Omnitrophota bacterium]